MAVHLIGWSAMNRVISHLPGVKASVRAENQEIASRARGYLAAANATQRITPKGYFPAYITTEEGDVDCFTILHAPNAVALEFGHAPSGVFGPGGALAHVKSKAPEGLYIVSHAAGLL